MDLNELKNVKDPKELDEKLGALVEADMVKRISLEVEAKKEAEPKAKPKKK